MGYVLTEGIGNITIICVVIIFNILDIENRTKNATNEKRVVCQHNCVGK